MLDAKRSEDRFDSLRITRRLRDRPVVLRELIFDASEKEVVDGGEKEIARLLSRAAGRGDGQELLVGSNCQRKPRVEWRADELLDTEREAAREMVEIDAHGRFRGRLNRVAGQAFTPAAAARAQPRR